MMRKAARIVLVVLVVGAVSIGVVVIVAGPDTAPRQLAGLTGDVSRGAYVARLAGCIACHTDSRGGGAVLAGGAAVETPFGSFYAPNITPHEADGIGAWRLEDFARALTAGFDPAGRHYYPSFPYPFYARMTDQDIVDLWAAVRSVPAVEGETPDHDLAFPFDQRAAIGAWKWLNFAPQPAILRARDEDALERGRYIVEGPGHCGACHTPRDVFGGRRDDSRLAGAVGADGEKVPAITAGALDEAGWTGEDIAYALRAAIKPDGDVFGGSMAEVVLHGTRFWSQGDLAAVASYLLASETVE